jgi:hypothetical protein
MGRKKADVELVKITQRKDYRAQVKGEIFDQRVKALYEEAWPGTYRGHAKWWCHLSGWNLSVYWRVKTGVRGSAKRYFNLLNLMEAMKDEVGIEAIRKLGPGFILGITEYKPTKGCFASTRRSK